MIPEPKNGVKLLCPAKAIRFVRLERGLSAREVALKAGFSASYVHKIESGEIEPTIKKFAKIAEVLEMSDLEILVLIRSCT